MAKINLYRQQNTDKWYVEKRAVKGDRKTIIRASVSKDAKFMQFTAPATPGFLKMARQRGVDVAAFPDAHEDVAVYYVLNPSVLTIKEEVGDLVEQLIGIRREL